MDTFDKVKRSEIMSRVKHEHTQPEVQVRKYLFSQGFRYRTNVKKLPGSPDIVLSKYKTAIFVNGCLWHGHYCRAGTRPVANKEYWNDKIEKNIARDKKNIAKLQHLGWKTIVIWQCELRNIQLANSRLASLVSEIRSH